MSISIWAEETCAPRSRTEYVALGASERHKQSHTTTPVSAWTAGGAGHGPLGRNARQTHRANSSRKCRCQS